MISQTCPMPVFLSRGMTKTSWAMIPRDAIALDSAPFTSDTLYRGVNSDDDQRVVVRRLEIERAGVPNPAARVRLDNALDLWTSLKHPNVLRVRGAIECPPHAVFLVSECAGGGDIATYLHTTKVTKQQMWGLLHNAALGLAYLHERGVVHGNLKISNILVGDDGKAKLADYGLRSIRAALTTASGVQSASLRWCAPECLTGRPTKESDVYAIAMCIIAAATGEPPFALVEDAVVYQLKRDGQLLDRPPELSSREWALIHSMTHRVPSKRCSMEEVLDTIKSYASEEASDSQELRDEDGCISMEKVTDLLLCGAADALAYRCAFEALSSLPDGADVEIPEKVVTKLIDFVRDSENDELVAVCIGGLLKLLKTKNPSHCYQILIDTGTTDVLVGLWRNGSPSVKHLAASALMLLAFHSDSVGQDITKSAGQPTLALVLDCLATAKELADKMKILDTLFHTASQKPDAFGQEALRVNAVPGIVNVLFDTDVYSVEQAERILVRLLYSDSAAAVCDAMAQVYWGVNRIFHLLSAGTATQSGLAVVLLQQMAQYPIMVKALSACGGDKLLMTAHREGRLTQKQLEKVHHAMQETRWRITAAPVRFIRTMITCFLVLGVVMLWFLLVLSVGGESFRVLAPTLTFVPLIALADESTRASCKLTFKQIQRWAL